ncbi:MAG: site-2 protease family protein [Lachnospiraceae bacterium]|nr:site-2 protease family protein [Lachnospiraceae bacterium]
MSTVVSIIAFILIIGLLIFFHEFGHFLLAKKNKVGVTEFSIGMGPKMFSKVKNGTNFVVRWIPFGGYCMMLGDESFVADPSLLGEQVDMDEEHAYSKKSVWARMSITLAGPVFNFVLALILSTVLVALIGVSTTKIYDVVDGYPAQEAGLQGGDEIVKLNRTRVHQFQDISIFLALHEGEDVEVTYKRDGVKYTTTLSPKLAEDGQTYMIGIYASPRTKDLSVLQVFQYGFYNFEYNAGAVIKSLGLLFRGKLGLNDLSGPVGMAGIVNDIVKDVEEDTKDESFFVTAYWVFINLLNFTALISANLGIMNLLPVPGLDGGKFLFLLVEAVIRKPVPKKMEGIITIAGFVLLIGLMVVVLFNDIIKVFFRR